MIALVSTGAILFFRQQANAHENSRAPSGDATPGVVHHALKQSHVGFYAVFLPPDYDAPENAGRRYPLCVILHGNGSNEISHGRVSNRLGRDGVIYLAPRAPHPSYEAFLGTGQAGFTAWPTYPEEWGRWDSETFPHDELRQLDAIQIYVDWIAQTIAHAQTKYRTDGKKAFVFGHSEGATFAYSFAIRRPDLVHAFFAYAGYYGLESLDEANAAVLKEAQVLPFIAHSEGDRVVSIAKSRALLSFLEKHDVPHRKALFDAGDHGMGKAAIIAAQSFFREQTARSSGGAAVTSSSQRSPSR